MTTDQTLHCRKLLPCPFCGERPAHDHQAFAWCVGDDCFLAYMRVRIEAWNTRAQASAPEGRDDALVAAFRVALNALIRERVVYGEDLETMHRVLRRLQASGQEGEPVAWMRIDDPVSWHRSFIPASAKPMDPDNTYNVPLYTRSNAKAGEADARLIAAAPELLAALRAVVAVADRKTDEFDMARAAMAKAECETSHD